MFIIFFSLVMLTSCGATGKERNYTGSTPAGPVTRSFLGIPLSDSIDFIRWQLFIHDDPYHLHAHFGIGKPNTNGFMNDGVKLELSGTIKHEKNFYSLQNGDKALKLIELNEDLLHIVDADNSMLAGNGGWSYTLNNMMPTVSDKVTLPAQSVKLKDSMAFEGRTPCKIPGLFPPDRVCYKVKWYVVLYSDVSKNEPAGYQIKGTAWRKEGGITGSWKIVKGKDNRTVYQLKVDKENLVLYLLKTDENVLVFTDDTGKLLVGDEDFSYTLSRVF